MSKYVKQRKRFVKLSREAVVALLIVLAIVITFVGQHVSHKKEIAEINEDHKTEMEALRVELCTGYEAQIAEIEQYYEYGGDVSQIEREAEYISRVIYGTAPNHSEADKRAVVWCILNRVEHYSHPNTVIEVCEQPKQWMGYSADNPVLTEFYDLALEELKIWYSGGHRPVSNEYIYLSWSSREILLRDTFEENKHTNYWRMR